MAGAPASPVSQHQTDQTPGPGDDSEAYTHADTNGPAGQTEASSHELASQQVQQELQLQNSQPQQPQQPQHSQAAQTSQPPQQPSSRPDTTNTTAIQSIGKRKTTRRELTPFQRGQIVGAACIGNASIRDIARVFGINSSTVQRTLKLWRLAQAREQEDNEDADNANPNGNGPDHVPDVENAENTTTALLDPDSLDPNVPSSRSPPNTSRRQTRASNASHAAAQPPALNPSPANPANTTTTTLPSTNRPSTSIPTSTTQSQKPHDATNPNPNLYNVRHAKPYDGTSRHRSGRARKTTAEQDDAIRRAVKEHPGVGVKTLHKTVLQGLGISLSTLKGRLKEEHARRISAGARSARAARGRASGTAPLPGPEPADGSLSGSAVGSGPGAMSRSGSGSNGLREERQGHGQGQISPSGNNGQEERLEGAEPIDTLAGPRQVAAAAAAAQTIDPQLQS